jgi:hypothetical protein
MPLRVDSDRTAGTWIDRIEILGLRLIFWVPRIKSFWRLRRQTAHRRPRKNSLSWISHQDISIWQKPGTFLTGHDITCAYSSQVQISGSG